MNTNEIIKTTTVTNTNGKASLMLEKLNAIYNGDNTYSVNIWNFKTNKCEHFTVVSDERHTEMQFPDMIVELLTPELKGWMTK